ncbi:hypothetical protein [Sphingobium sp. DC-2]|uniref:hypothetical protein n=1 Tax=Sphingobium sp. DC-2 TaxID=1303256 RepID=UPI0004C41026|nr:hypothetical protein [Sphingobium sp. DC-2]
MANPNVEAVKILFQGYFDAWKTRTIPVPPRGLLVWAPGAVAEIGGHSIAVDPHDVADDPFFLQIEAEFYWSAIPDWRITELDVAGSDHSVMSFARFEGTGPDGVTLDPIWLADRWHFDAQGRIARWQQVTDLAAWARWTALTGQDYPAYIAEAFAKSGQPPRFVP